MIDLPAGEREAGIWRIQFRSKGIVSERLNVALALSGLERHEEDATESATR